jgi:AbrB family looped-hinge helix DNA binding protein
MLKQYRLKLMGKGQMTAPAAMRAQLRMREGDELELAVEDDRIVGAQVLRPVPTELFTPELLGELEQRVKRFGADAPFDSTVEGLRKRVMDQADRQLNAR